MISTKRYARASCRKMLSLLLVLCLQAIAVSGGECACELQERPDVSDKALTARWMVHSLDWGVVSSISTRLGGDDEGGQIVPFGNVYSFVDGTCDKATGVPYLYGTYMDQSFADAKSNDMISLTLSESSLSSVCPNNAIDSCMLGSKYGDPESPVCARLTLTGNFVALEDGSEEFVLAKQALFERHPSMRSWPDGHGWVVAKIDIQDIWLIDYFGGATVLDPKDYFAIDFADEYETVG
mmetsp:Transcript_19214/g.41755  ORF Transcript_19214/g.41755 Transcript_19214/m.41755 type:complete len:238 (-) Transcript_19214:1246-1959(-)